MERDEMLVMLKAGVCKVTFTKVNGEKREMRCTLVRDMIPPESTPKLFDDEKLENTSDVIRVFDLDARGWRSFKIANVIEFKYE